MTAPLDKLHDFYQPPPPSWRPQTIGWYVVFAIAALLLLWLVVHLIRRWIADRYRREALHELAHARPEQLSELLKRTALSGWPREKVASLSGATWLKFLDDSAHIALFQRAPASMLEEIALRHVSLSTEDESALRQAAATWIRMHRRPGRPHVQA
jgi:Domain of unknown function (DUF4381)